METFTIIAKSSTHGAQLILKLQQNIKEIQIVFKSMENKMEVPWDVRNSKLGKQFGKTGLKIEQLQREDERYLTKPLYY